jgi:uncharacterized protein (TIGR02145 family)
MKHSNKVTLAILLVGLICSFSCKTIAQTRNNKSTSKSKKKLTENVISKYKTVKIGKQIWMAENLNVDHYRNGDPIPEVKNPEQWKNTRIGAWCYYNNDSQNGKKYGKLYNWYAVNDPRGIAPEGWHVPTIAEFETLAITVNQDGNALKAIGQGLGNGVGTNKSNFSALLVGSRNDYGHFDNSGSSTSFWSITESSGINNAISWHLDDSGSYISLVGYTKGYGFSIRCLSGDDKSTNQSEKKSTEIFDHINKTVKIGEQEWMTENLNVDHYRNGDLIPELKDPVQWRNFRSGAWCYYNNDPENGKKYGKLYNWYAVSDSRGLAPEGWQIPTQSDFQILVTTVNNDGNTLKAIGEGTGTNLSGFSALLGGSRVHDGSFCDLSKEAYFWSATEHHYQKGYVNYLHLVNDGNNINLDYDYKDYGNSVRCIKGYKTIKIGGQTWMAENLNVDHYKNGDPIREVRDPEQWSNLKNGAWCYYNNDPENGKKYGKLYNWYAVDDPRGLAPEGWHVATKDEFENLKTVIKGEASALISKETGFGLGTNTSGFSAMLAGYRSNGGIFSYFESSAYYWSNTALDHSINARIYDSPPHYRTITSTSSEITYLGLFGDQINILNVQNGENIGYSIRCVKD